MKVLFELTFNREVVAALLEYMTVRILLWILKLLSALNTTHNLSVVNTTHPEILRQWRLKLETKINRRGHEIFFEKVTGPWTI